MQLLDADPSGGPPKMVTVRWEDVMFNPQAVLEWFQAAGVPLDLAEFEIVGTSCSSSGRSRETVIKDERQLLCVWTQQALDCIRGIVHPYKSLFEVLGYDSASPRYAFWDDSLQEFDDPYGAAGPAT